MNFQHHKERAESIERGTHSAARDVEYLAGLLGGLADVVADLCDDLSPSTPPAGEWRRGMWLQEASKRYLLVEQDDDEILWAVHFDSVGIASPKLSTLMPNSPDYVRCEAPGWWTE